MFYLTGCVASLSMIVLYLAVYRAKNGCIEIYSEDIFTFFVILILSWLGFMVISVVILGRLICTIFDYIGRLNIKLHIGKEKEND